MQGRAGVELSCNSSAASSSLAIRDAREPYHEGWSVAEAWDMPHEVMPPSILKDEKANATFYTKLQHMMARQVEVRMTRLFPRVAVDPFISWQHRSNRVRDDRKLVVERKANRGWLTHTNDVCDVVYEHHTRTILSGVMIITSVTGLAAVLFFNRSNTS